MLSRTALDRYSSVRRHIGHIRHKYKSLVGTLLIWGVPNGQSEALFSVFLPYENFFNKFLELYDITKSYDN